MRIVLLLPGSGTRFYCENCARDGGLAAGLIARGHEVTVFPLYLPLEHTPEEDHTGVPVFYGAVGIYLRHMFPALRGAPGWVARAFDSRPALKLAGALSGATNAGALGGLTVSMLKGEEGNQRGELEELIGWLDRIRPDVVHMSNGLLLGLAGRIREKLGIPIVCSLQDEDGWIDAMDASSADLTWDLMAERASDVDLFLPVSRCYADAMKARLALAEEKIRVIPIGVDADRSVQSRLPFDPPVIGYLSHMNETMGLGLLVDAFLLLRRNPKYLEARLAISGGVTGGDHRWLRNLLRKLRRAGAGPNVSVVPLSTGLEFLSSLTVLSVPVHGGEAFGTFQIEAMARGVPVVQPALGAFPEVVQATGGGITYLPNSAPALAAALEGLLDDPEELRRFGRNGRDSVLADYTLDGMIEKIETAYRWCV